MRRQLVVRVVHQVRRPGHHPRIRRLRPVSTVRRRREDPESIAVVSLFSSPYVRATRLTPCLFNSCANHDESGGAHAGQDPQGHGHGHGGSNDSSSTVFGALGPPGSTLPGFTGVVPSSLEQLFDTLELVDHAGAKLDPAVHFKGKVVGVYFSSGTCPGCVRFSPTLNAFTEVNARDYVTVLVPGDRDEASARAYANRYPAFASVPYNR